MTAHRLACSIIALLTSMGPGLSSGASLADMADKLDQLDRLDFNEALDVASSCTRRRDFACTERKLAQAKPLANSADDKARLVLAQKALADEIQSVEAERLAKIDEKYRVAKLQEEEEIAEARRRWRRSDQDSGSSSSGSTGITPQLLLQGLAAASNGRVAVPGMGSSTTADPFANTVNSALKNLELHNQMSKNLERSRSDYLAQQAAQAQREREHQLEIERNRDRERERERERSNPRPLVAQSSSSASEAPLRVPSPAPAARAGADAPPSAIGATPSGSPAREPISAKPAPTAIAVAGANPTSSSAKTPRTELGDPVLEGIAVCRQNPKSGGWGCNGTLDNQIIFDEPSLASALKRQNCEHPLHWPGSPVIRDQVWEIYRCGIGMGPGDNDVAKRYGLTVPRSWYRCAKSFYGRCDKPYEPG